MTDTRPGTLYVVATPIGNLEDMSLRAVRVLKEVQVIACEDTRHSAPLLAHFDIRTPLCALHDFNEREALAPLQSRLLRGDDIALISDAGTPLVSDPGFRLVRGAHEVGVRVCAVPGPSALIAALSISGLATDRFAFEGFPPAKSGARQAFFQRLQREPRTLVFYESPHRILECLADMVAAFGGERGAAVGRELTKRFETLYSGTLADILRTLEAHKEQRQGEFVVLVAAGTSGDAAAEDEQTARRTLALLLAELPTAQAVAIAAKLTGKHRNLLYRWALELRS